MVGPLGQDPVPGPRNSRHSLATIHHKARANGPAKAMALKALQLRGIRLLLFRTQLDLSLLNCIPLGGWATGGNQRMSRLKLIYRAVEAVAMPPLLSPHPAPLLLAGGVREAEAGGGG